MSSIFTKIVEGKIPCYKIDESEDCLAFLDINPNAYGHTLCILKREVDYIFDLSDHEYLSLMKFSKKIAKALKKSVNCERIAVSVVGLEVPKCSNDTLKRYCSLGINRPRLDALALLSSGTVNLESVDIAIYMLLLLLFIRLESCDFSSIFKS